MSDNSLHFFINGVDVGKKIKTIPSVLYGVVDVFGQAEEVTITGMGFDYFSPSEAYDWLKIVDENMDKTKAKRMGLKPHFPGNIY